MAGHVVLDVAMSAESDGGPDTGRSASSFVEPRVSTVIWPARRMEEIQPQHHRSAAGLLQTCGDAVIHLNGIFPATPCLGHDISALLPPQQDEVAADATCDGRPVVA